MLVILVGNSGVGKTTLQTELIRKGDFHWSRRPTTRPRRDDEYVAEYLHTTQEAFNYDITKMICISSYGGYMYGTYKDFVEQYKKKDIVLTLTPAGLVELITYLHSIDGYDRRHIMPIKVEALDEHLNERLKDDAQRRSRPIFEIEEIGIYDYTLWNDKTVEIAYYKIMKTVIMRKLLIALSNVDDVPSVPSMYPTEECDPTVCPCETACEDCIREEDAHCDPVGPQGTRGNETPTKAEEKCNTCRTYRGHIFLCYDCWIKKGKPKGQ